MVVDQLNEAADLIYSDKGADVLTRAVGDWLRAEAVTQQQIEPLTELLNLAVKTRGGPEAYLRVVKREDGEIEMRTDTNEHALVVATEIKRRYEGARSER